MTDRLDPTLYLEELPQAGRDAYKGAQAQMNGWRPTEFLRFVERGVPPRRILQQLWAASTHEGYAEWRDVPLADEEPRNSAHV